MSGRDRYDWDDSPAAEQGNYGGDEGGFDNDGGNNDD